MTDATHPDTIDWHRFWNEAEGDRRLSAAPGAYGKVDLLARFFEQVGAPADLGSFGCGPADLLFDLAERYPDLELVGYDAARSIVAANRERANEEGAGNLRFVVDVLPDVEAERRFDLVYCYATLHYVEDVERALETLYDRVREGGHLVFNYPNRLTPAEYRRIMAGDLDGPLEVDPEAFAERFSLVLDRENLLSYERIHDVLGTWPRSFWSAVDAPDEGWTGRATPWVYRAEYPPGGGPPGGPPRHGPRYAPPSRRIHPIS